MANFISLVSLLIVAVPLVVGQNLPNCGIKPNLPEPRIVGGQEARPHEFPWQVRLKIKKSRATYRCGGSILNKRWILTAAHCVYDSSRLLHANTTKVIAGAHNLQLHNREEPTRVKARSVKIIPNPNHSYLTGYDIALIKLDRDLPLSTGLTPSTIGPIGSICLPEPELIDQQAGKLATATGWGRLGYGGDSPSVLQKVNVTVLPESTCVNQYGKMNLKITKQMLCAEDTGKGTCQGDSGGPLVVAHPDGKWYQYGVTSFGVRCVHPDFAGVYARVTELVDWVWQTVANN